MPELPSIQALPTIDYPQHPAYGKTFGPVSLGNRFRALKTLSYPLFRQVVSTILRDVLAKRRDPVSPESAKAGKLFDQVAQDGVASRKVTETLKADLKRELQPFVEKLQAHLESRPVSERTYGDAQLRMLRPDAPGVFDAVDAILRDEEVYQAASAWQGKDLSLLFVTLQINDSDDHHWRSVFPDMNTPMPAAHHLHVDTVVKIFKAIIYVNDVTPATGPFSYVPGTHRIPMGRVEHVIRSSIDHSGLHAVDRKRRELFWSLPHLFQRKATFGTDLLDDQPETVELLQAERHFVSSDGDLLVFDPSGMHRGGMVEEGKRMILQIGLR